MLPSEKKHFRSGEVSAAARPGLIPSIIAASPTPRLVRAQPVFLSPHAPRPCFPPPRFPARPHFPPPPRSPQRTCVGTGLPLLLMTNMEQNHTILQTDIAVLTQENASRRAKIKEIGARIGKLMTTDDERSHYSVISENENDEPVPRPGGSARHDSSVTPPVPIANHRANIPAKDVVRTIKSFRGRDDIGVEDFITSIKIARTQCKEEDFLLRLIIAEKITEHAERSIRHLSINSYDELYDALRKHVAPATTVGNARSKLKDIKQGNTESVHSYNLRFRQQYSELRYTIQYNYAKPQARKVMLDSEEESSNQTYIQNLRSDISQLVYARHPLNLTLAQQCATETETWLREASSRSQSSSRTAPLPRRLQSSRTTQESSTSRSHPTAAASTESPSNTPVSPVPRTNLKCTYCSIMGHTINQCRKRNFHLRQQGKLPPRVNQLTESQHQEYHEPPVDYDTSTRSLEECEVKEDYSLTHDQE